MNAFRMDYHVIWKRAKPITNMFLTQTSAVKYEELCRLDMLGLQDHPVGNHDLVYEEYKKQPVKTGMDGTKLPYST